MPLVIDRREFFGIALAAGGADLLLHATAGNTKLSGTRTKLRWR